MCTVSFPYKSGSADNRVKGLVSTIIPVYNRAEMLRQAVQSVLAQTYRPIEIIIADDGSTDDAGSVADELAGKHPREIRVVHNPNQGPGPARESGRQLARGEFIQYLDSDDRLLPNKFALQVAALEAKPDADIAYGITRLINAAGRVLKEPFKWTGKKIMYLFPGLLVDRWWCTHTPLYRRSLCDCIGPWSDLRYSQDWEYDARAGALEAKLVHVDRLVSEHRTHAGIRQTGGGKWLMPEDQVRFFTSIYTHARSAGVQANTPEMCHFSRWVFAAARSVGKRKNKEAAKSLFDLSVTAKGGLSNEFIAYRVLTICIGWKHAACIVDLARSIIGREPGEHTLDQSWMEVHDN